MNTGVGCHALLQGIFPTQGLNPHLLSLLLWQQGSLPLAPPGKPGAVSPSSDWMRPTHIMKSAESEEELKSLWVKVKEDSEIAGFKLNIQKTKIMASSPITSWQIDAGKWKE